MSHYGYQSLGVTFFFKRGGGGGVYRSLDWKYKRQTTPFKLYFISFSSFSSIDVRLYHCFSGA